MDNLIKIGGGGIKETVLYGTNEPSKTGVQNASASVNIGDYDLIKFWLGGDKGSWTDILSKPIYVSAKETGNYTLANNTKYSEIGTCSVTATTVTYNAKSDSYGLVNGIVGVKFN